MKPLGLLLVVVLLFASPACGGKGGEGITLPGQAADQILDHFRLVVPAVIESGYEKFAISIIAENRFGDVLSDYRDDWPEAYPFLIVPGLASFVPKFTGGLMNNDWVNGIATLECHFHRGTFAGQSCPVQGYWTLLLEENGPIVVDNSYIPWIIEIQGRVYW